MTLNATFSVESSTAVQAHAVNYGDTVDMELQSTTGVETIAWEILSTSYSGQTAPSLSLSGVPTGKIAQFTQISDPGDGLGRAYLVKLTISNQAEGSVSAYRIVGTRNAAGAVPGVPGEELARDATHGWGPVYNRMLATALLPTQGTYLTGASGTPGQTITVDQGALRVLAKNLTASAILDIDNTNANDNESITVVSLNTAAFTYTIRDHSNVSQYVIPASTPMVVTLRKASGGNFGSAVGTRLAALP